MTRILYSCDVHSSEKTYRKFVNALKLDLYHADVAILAGDLAGKAIIPIVARPDGTYLANFLGRKENCDEQGLHVLEKKIMDMGFFPHKCSPSELEEFQARPEKIDELFVTMLRNTIERWLALAKERLENSKVRFYMLPGNDDPPIVAEVLSKSERVINPEDRVVMIDDEHEMISSGQSNPTPWNTPRECSEQELQNVIERMAVQVRDMQKCVFNFHVPPYNSTLDIAPLLDKDLHPQVTAGEILKVPVGSTAVRAAIEKYQPLLGLHGHIHESSSEARIGRTLCLNPGSEYSEGILRAYVVDVESKSVRNYVRIQG